MDLYKSNTLSQLLQQSEIDVVGVRINENNIDIFAYDIAYHGGGLNYVDKIETRNRIVKKLFRMIMTIWACFDKLGSFKCVFASPFVGNSFGQPLIEGTDLVNEFLHKNNFDTQVELVINDDFTTKIYNPLLSNITNIEDTSELFIRSLQLARNQKVDTIVSEPTKISTHISIYEKEDKCISKTDAMAKFQNSNLTLTLKNTTFASLNKTSGNYWANPNKELLKCDWFLILNNPQKKQLYLLKIPAHTLETSSFRMKNGDLIDLNIDPFSDNLIDVKTKRQFAQFKINECKYDIKL
jgi:hypothetical protein